MSIQNCYLDIKENAKREGKTISEEKLKLLASRLYEYQQKGLTPAEYQAKVQEIVGQELKERAQAAKVRELQHLQQVMQAAKIVADERNGRSWIQNLQDYYEGGGIRAGDSSNLDPRVMSGAIGERLYSMFRKMTAPYKAVLESGTADQHIFQELDNIQRGGTESVSGNKLAFDLAQSIDTLQEKIFSMKKAFNPLLEKASDFLIHRSHDRETIAATPKEKWVADAMAAFGQKSFPGAGLDDKISLFSDMYDRIKNGIYATSLDDSRIPNDLLKKMAMSRELVANDWKAAWEYNKNYGDGNVMVTLHKFIKRGAEDIAQLQKFGPDAKKFHKDLVNILTSTADEASIQEFRSRESSINNSFKQGLGVANAPAMTGRARAAQQALTWSYLAHSGQALLSSWTDVALAPGIVRGLNGGTVIGNFANIALNYARFMAPLSGEARARVLETYGIFSHSANRELLNIVGGAEQQPGRLMRAAQLFGKLTMLDRHIEAMKAATAEAMGSHLSKITQIDYAGLENVTKNFLMRYGIKENEWELFRQAGIDRDAGNWKYRVVDPEAIDELPDAAVKKYISDSGLYKGSEVTPELINRAKYELSTKVATMFNEMADIGSSTPGTKQIRWMYGGTDINSEMGILTRLFWQFKSAAVTTMDAYRRIHASGENPNPKGYLSLDGDLSGWAQTGMLAAGMWTMSKYAKDALMGKTPQDPSDPKFVMEMVAGSGFGGFLADALANEYRQDNYYKAAGDIAKNFFGPIPAAMFDATQTGLIGVDAMSEKSKTKGEDFVHSAVKNIIAQAPGQNIFWLKPLLHTYIFNAIKEMTHNGYVSNLERSVSKTPGLFGDKQEYFIDALKPTVIK
jgi:hypothetical protein